MPAAKRKATADGRDSLSQSAPVVKDANAAKCGDDCPASELVVSESDELEITMPMDQHGKVPPHETWNLEKPEVLSVPKSGTTGIAEGQLSLDIGSFCLHHGG